MASSCKAKQQQQQQLNSNKCGSCKPATPVDHHCNNNNNDVSSNNQLANNNCGEEQLSEEHFSYIKRVGAYLVGRTLGEGSFAKVRLGLHLPTAEKVAIKVLDKHRAANDSYMEMTIRREGRLLRRIRPHPNIVQLYEVMETANSLYLVLELCEGGDFLDLVASRGRLSESECRMFLRQIIDAVAHLHSFGILHRDLKIENFMLDSTQQQIKIIDLGLSTAAPGGSAATRTQCGSPAYAAPELIRSPHYGPEVDVWSIGVDMFAMLTGGLPFTVEPFSIKNLYAKMIAREMNPLPSDTTPEAVDLLHRLLEPDPRLRITLQAALAHPWLRTTRRIRYTVEAGKCHFPHPNSIKIINGMKSKGDVPTDPSILDLTIATRAAALAGCSLGSLLRDVAAAVPSNLAATYHLLAHHMKRASDQNDDTDCHNHKQCSSPLSSESASAVAARQNNAIINGNNTINNHYIIQQGHIPHVTRRYDPSNNNNDLEISYIASSPKPCVGGIINNMTRVPVVAAHSLHRPPKLLPQQANQQSPMTLITAASAAVSSGEHHNRATFLPANNCSATPECRPHSIGHHISGCESEPSGVQTLERRRLRHPRLAAPLSRHDEEEHSKNNITKTSAPDVALSNNDGDTRDGDNSNNNSNSSNDGESVQTARYLGTSAPVSETEGARWGAGDGNIGGLPQCLLTSCCGELPIKTGASQQHFFNNHYPASMKQSDVQTPPSTPQRVPTSTPTPPSCMQVSHIVTKNGNNELFCQSPSTNGRKSIDSSKSDNSATRKAIAMFGCVGRDQRRLSSNVGDFVFSTGKKQSYTPDGYSFSDVEQHNQYLGRMISSKTPPPPVAVLTPVVNNNGHNTYLFHHSHQNNNGHHQMTAAALIVKPAVQAVAAAARRVLCGASPQPSNIQHGTLDRSMARNAAAKQAAV